MEDFSVYKENLEQGGLFPRPRKGIGTLSEKSLHAALKNYLEPDTACQEIPVGGFVADIYNARGITEIQTAHFEKLREKLQAFLPLEHVTLVYPIAVRKYLSILEPETGEVTRRCSPLKGCSAMAFPELYKIKPYLKHPHLHLRLMLLEVEEYRMLAEKKRGCRKGFQKIDLVPLSLYEQIFIDEPEDYRKFLPPGLPELFTSADYKRVLHISPDLAGMACHMLHYMEILERQGRRGNAYLYRERDREV